VGGFAAIIVYMVVLACDRTLPTLIVFLVCKSFLLVYKILVTVLKWLDCWLSYHIVCYVARAQIK